MQEAKAENLDSDELGLDQEDGTLHLYPTLPILYPTFLILFVPVKIFRRNAKPHHISATSTKIYASSIESPTMDDLVMISTATT